MKVSPEKGISVVGWCQWVLKKIPYFAYYSLLQDISWINLRYFKGREIMNTTCLKIQFNSKQTQTAALVEIKAFLLWLRESFLDVLSSVFFKQAVLYWKKKWKSTQENQQKINFSVVCRLAGLFSFMLSGHTTLTFISLIAFRNILLH